MLDKIFERQLELQRKSFGVSPNELDAEGRRDYIVDMMLALQDELHEALNETGWKAWQTSRHFHKDRFGNELIDALHFLVNLFLVAGWTADDVEAAYFEKAAINAARQAKGYDGLNKCKGCNRALDDPAVECTAVACHA